MLHQLGEVRAVAETLGDRPDIRPPAVRRDLRAVNDPLPNVVDAPLRLGVTAQTESEAREKFTSAVDRWMEILAAEGDAEYTEESRRAETR